MNKKQTEEENKIEKNLEYLGLDLENIPKSLLEYETLDFRVSKSYEENKYRQYRYIPIKDIQILLSPTNRLEELNEKYQKASPLGCYLVPDTEDNILKHTTFLNMLKSMNIEDIEKVEEEQKELSKKIPFKVKYPGNYLWQIYYSENTDKYFMLVPTEDSDYSTFFYLMKKKLKKRVMGNIFVPVSHVDYSREYLEKSQFEDIENYLWLFTKDWPLVYEVYDKTNKLSIQIVGETELYGKIKSYYKIKLTSKEDANKFYKLLKALFILQTELPHYFKFTTNIDKSGSLEFYKDNKKIEYNDLVKFIKDEFEELEKNQKDADENIIKYKEMLEKLKQESALLELEYIEKEKQISTFLECKKTFFGKVKYFFKYSNKKSKGKHQKEKIEEKEEEVIETEEKPKEEKNKKENYTLEELIEEYKKFELKETEIKNTVMDVNAIKLKNKNLTKKIENASLYIKEIDNHKKSIFEFWKYSNKDEVAALAEGEEEEINVEQKIIKVFDYEEDLENLGIAYDKLYRKKLSNEELDSIYVYTTNMLDILNKVKNNKVKPKEIEDSLKELKVELNDEIADGKEEIDIFGGMIEDSRKLKTMANKKHREIPRDKINILELNKSTKQLEYKLSLERQIEKVKTALENNKLDDDIPIYKLLTKEEIDNNNFNVFNLNPENEISNINEKSEKKFNFYKINIKQGTNAILLTNIIYYNNKNKTLPEGMNLSTNILVDLSKVELELKNKTSFKIVSFEDEKNELSKFDIKDINVFEYDIKE